MTTTTAINATDWKRKTFEDRQRDTGWGWAFAHILPIAPIIYAAKRRTITPILYSICGTFGAGFTLGLLLALGGVETTEQQDETMGLLVGLVASPLLAKHGIEKARKFAAAKLEEDA